MSTEPRNTVEATPAANTEFEKIREAALNVIGQFEEAFPDSQTNITGDQLTTLRGSNSNVQKQLEETPYAAPINRLYNELWRLSCYFRSQEHISGMKDLVFESIPKFVYYSNYGNLDAEIYLPQAIENMSRANLTGIAEARARTLKVLFEYVT